jgi:hypothetical protein
MYRVPTDSVSGAVSGKHRFKAIAVRVFFSFRGEQDRRCGVRPRGFVKV